MLRVDPQPDDVLVGADMEPSTGPPPTSDEGGDVLAQQSRTLRNSLLSLTIFFGLVVGLLLSVPGLARRPTASPTPASPGSSSGLSLRSWPVSATWCCSAWCSAALSSDLGSRLPLSELAVNSIVSVSGLAGIALGAWVLRSKGVSVHRIAKRSVLLFVLTSAVNVGAVVVIGLAMWVGLVPGSRNPLLTLLPAGVALAAILGTVWLAGWARRTASRREDRGGRRTVALVAISGGVEEALHLIAAREWRLLGALAYWLFDNLVLFACLAAFGPTLSFWAVAMAYLVGMMANSIPIPGGFLAVEGGLAGMLALFGARPASLVIAAVLVYRAISLWIPATIGSVAFLSLRREMSRATPQAA